MTVARHARPIAIILLAATLALPAAAEDFWFATVADAHMRDEAAAEIVRDAVGMINADERIEMSLWLGDLTDRSTEAEFVLSKQVLGGLAKPWYALRGNHDDTGEFYQQYFGALNTRVEHEGWVFLLFDSNGPRDTMVTDETMAWLQEQARTIPPGTPVVLAAHHPLLLGGLIPLAGAPEILALFKDHDLKAVLAGHLHTNQEHSRGGALYTVNVCCATTRGNIDGDPRRGYRLFHCRDGELTTEFVTVREVCEDLPADDEP